MEIVDLHLVPVSLRAKTEDELTSLCLINNTLNHVKFNYQTPYESSKGDVVVWFYANLRDWKDPSSLDDKEIKIMMGEIR